MFVAMAILPTRSEAIAAAQERGQRIVAVLPIHYPRELLRAHGFHPVEVWGPPGIEPTEGNVHFQAYTCAIIQNAISLLIRGGLDVADAVLVPNSCDALQGAGSVLKDFVKPKHSVLTLYPPRATRESDMVYFAEELKRLGAALTALSGVAPDEEALHSAIATEEAADRAALQLASARMQTALGDLDFYSLLRTREYLAPDAFVALAQEAATSTAPTPVAPDSSVPVMLSGIVPEPMQIFTELGAMGAHVVADDFACMSRRFYPAAAASGDPFRRMAERLLGSPPDPMRGSPILERCDYLLGRLRDAGAKGLIVYDVKFCEPELFDLPMVRQRLVDEGFPVLHLEVELTGSLPGQTLTRMEAFVETLQ